MFSLTVCNGFDFVLMLDMNPITIIIITFYNLRLQQTLFFEGYSLEPFFIEKVK